MDKRAIRILNDAYWGPQGWKPDANCRAVEADFVYAKSAGVMFDPIALDHRGIVKRCLAIREQIDPKSVANAFVWSLGTCDLAHRSALGSYAVLRNFPNHAWKGTSHRCAVCGSVGRKDPEKYDLNILNFERHKWGGVRHLDSVYALFDLEQFCALPPVKPEPEHVGLLSLLIASIEQAPAGTTAAALQNQLPKTLGATKAERSVLIEILGLAGILEREDHRGFLRSFVRADQRALPARKFVDMAYPACWWTQSDGVNKEAIRVWFNHLL